MPCGVTAGTQGCSLPPQIPCQSARGLLTQVHSCSRGLSLLNYKVHTQQGLMLRVYLGCENEAGRQSQSKALKRAGDRALGTWQERGDEATSRDDDKGLDSRLGCTSTLLSELGLTYPSGTPYPFPKVKPKINLPCSLQSTGWL